jgi:hypothetical protein
MARVRLTQRAKRRQAVEDNIPYPGTVNQPNRKFKTRDQYDNWEEVVNHPLPDMRTEWKDNPRDEIGFGIPKINAVRAAATKAVKLAYLFLGDKVDEATIEKQARDFMKLSSKQLDASLKRYASTEAIYAEDQNTETGADADTETEMQDQEAAQVQETAPEQEEAQRVVEAEEEEVEEEEVEEVEEAGKKANFTDLDVEIGGNTEVHASEETDSELESIFASDDEEEEVEEEEVVESKKASKRGIQRLGQPKVASSKSSNLSTLWADAPDVSSVFN